MLTDQLDLLSAFNAHGVEYLVVGGHAVNIYTQPRSTKDLDVWIHATEANPHRVYDASAAFGAPLNGVRPADFQMGSEFYFQLGTEANRIDVLQTISGVSFEDAWPVSVSGALDDVPVKFISRDHLILNKLASGRARDMGDVEELRKFQEKAK